MSSCIKVLVGAGFGINCQEELAAAWKLAGAEAEIVHLNELFSGHRQLDEFKVFCLPGGFSFGDDLGSGKVLASRIRYRRLPDGHRFFDDLKAFITAGGYVVGICNGFQALVKSGLLPDLAGCSEQEVTLAANDSGRFEDRWVRLGADPAAVARNPWLAEVASIELPIRHGEGKLIVRDNEVLQKLQQNGLVLWRYLDASGRPTDEYPANPNGSALQAAALCDLTGRVIGMMPHPEAYLDSFLHPAHGVRSGRGREAGDGLRFFSALTSHITRSAANNNCMNNADPNTGSSEHAEGAGSVERKLAGATAMKSEGAR